MTVCNRRSDDTAFLTRLFGDSPHVAILKALLATDELSSRQLIARTGYEPDVLQVAVAKLESEGAIEAYRAEHTTYWRIDDDSPLAESLEQLRFAYSKREFYR